MGSSVQRLKCPGELNTNLGTFPKLSNTSYCDALKYCFFLLSKINLHWPYLLLGFLFHLH